MLGFVLIGSSHPHRLGRHDGIMIRKLMYRFINTLQKISIVTTQPSHATRTFLGRNQTTYIERE